MADYKIVYAVVERLGKRHWLRIGMAFVNRDGSLNVKLDALPLNGQLQIREQSMPAQRDGEEPAPPPVSAPSSAAAGRPLRRRGP